ncbi:MAG: hypothetical protein CL582_04445 [Alteromonadaceae bacterium]|nr:hypothetical protein [Alteromonadaceae bacterium]|tara:strand:+ start:13524 stop:14150 length:627 start_codon:yes stop_codon:yes gene_type:complete
MAVKMTPTVGARGTYQVKTPFSVTDGKVYVCEAVRSFDDLYQKNIDVYSQYYEPKGISRETFTQDKEAKANIVTLVIDDPSQNREVIYIPDTYILSFPSLGGVRYNRVVLSVDFALLPESIDLDDVKVRLGTVGSEVLGKVPDVNLHLAPYSGNITESEHEALEASRLDNITYQDTDHAKYLKERQKNQELYERIKTLEKILIDNNLI